MNGICALNVHDRFVACRRSNAGSIQASDFIKVMFSRLDDFSSNPGRRF